MKKSELKQIVAEVVLEELQAGNSKLSKLMMNHEKRNDNSLDENEDEFVDNTVEILMEHLHLEKEETIQETELDRMIHLAGIVENDSKAVESIFQIQGWRQTINKKDLPAYEKKFKKWKKDNPDLWWPGKKVKK